MTDHHVVRRLLWAMTSLCLVVALIAIPVVGDARRVDAGGGTGDSRRLPASPAEDRLDGGGDGGDAAAPAPNDAAASRDTAAPGAGADAPAKTGAPAAGPTAGPTGPSPTTTLPPAPAELGAAVDPGAPVPPRVGRYRYRTTGGPEGDGESTTLVEERSRAGDQANLAVTSTAGDLTTTSDVVWRPDGVRTLRSTLTFGSRSGQCDWEPDVVDAVFPLRSGATWTSDATCAVTGLSPTPITLQRSSTAKVLELRRTQVAGQTVDVWAIERTERLTGAGMSEEATFVALFSPKHGVDVDIRGTRSGQEYRRELLGLEPAPA